MRFYFGGPAYFARFLRQATIPHGIADRIRCLFAFGMFLGPSNQSLFMRLWVDPLPIAVCFESMWEFSSFTVVRLDRVKIGVSMATNIFFGTFDALIEMPVSHPRMFVKLS
jgi:hypothetical protein